MQEVAKLKSIKTALKVIAFIADYKVVDKIINHLKLEFIAERPPSPSRLEQAELVVGEAGAEYW